MRKTSIALSMIALLAVTTACSQSSSDDAAEPPSGKAVTIKTFKFAPDPLEVTAGDVVTWTNRDQILHTATEGTPEEPGDAFDGKMEGQGSTFAHTFREAGTYSYFCSRHNGMKGTIEVA